MRDARPEGSPYPKADLWLRGLARGADFVIAFGMAILGHELGAVLAVVYLLVADGLFHGQSPGKRIFGVRAMQIPRKAPVGYRESVLRNAVFALVALFYVVPLGWILLLLVGLPIIAFESWMVWTDRLGIRIGDIFADTQVVDGKVVTKIEVIATHAFPMSPAPPGPSAPRAVRSLTRAA
ncbi:MAG TPA: RDD family protein [Anaeromyxobacteraceae bacterium]|nr:RDD family protein [Anaeromyxobacteraceae bacterium]